jgi:hypothetical protein
VRVQAALAINNFVEHDCANELVLKALPELVQQLFTLINDVGNDEVVQSLDTLIEKYGERMGPYAVEVVRALSQHFIRLFTSEDTDDDDGAALTAMSVMRAISSMLHAVHGMPDKLAAMEAELLPLMARTMQEDASDFIEDSLDLLTTLTFYSPCISEALMSLIEPLHAALTTWAFEYSSAALPPVDNFMSRATATFLGARSGAYVKLVFGMCHHCLVTKHDAMNDYEANGAIRMLESLLYHCAEAHERMLPQLLEPILLRMERSKPDSTTRKLLFNALSTAIFRCASSTLQLLVAGNKMSNTLGAWMNHLSAPAKLKVHDLKISILAIGALLQLADAHAPPMIASNRVLLVRGGVRLLLQLQAAQEAAANEVKQGSGDDFDLGDESDDDDDLLGVNDGDGDSDAGGNAAGGGGGGGGGDGIASSMLKLRDDLNIDFDDDDFFDDDDDEEHVDVLDNVDALAAFVQGAQAACNHEPRLLRLLGLSPQPPEIEPQMSAEETATLHTMLSLGIARQVGAKQGVL